MTANVNAMVRAGVEAYRAGKRMEARTLLERAIELDEQNEQAWLWLSAVVDSTDDQIVCLQNVLIINPENDRARQGLRSLGVDPNTVVPAAKEAEDDFASAPAFETGTFDEYVVPSSSASVSGASDGPTSDDYDAWMENLNLGTEDEASQTPVAAETVDPFGDDGGDIFSDTDFASGDDAFGDDPFGDADFSSATDDDPFADSYSDDVYTDDYDDLLSSTDGGDDDLLDYDDSFDDLLSDDELLAEPVGATYDDADGGFLDDDDLLSDDYGGYDGPVGGLREIVAEHTSKIPSEIEPTRMPGIDAEAPRSARLITGLLAAVNIGAVAFVAFAVFQLTT